jgi:deoxyribodipyrimidine photo-lyase
VEALGLARSPRILAGGEAAARARLAAFLEGPAARYEEGRDRLGADGTSRLSADLKFGTLSPRTAWHAARAALSERAPSAWQRFSTELIWREFTHSLLWDRPELLERPFRADFARFPWENDAGRWEAWVAGRTGYPVVDAAARQLLEEGYVHNRARMITASFLTKDLLVDYRRGEAHFMTYLTDGDWAQNNFGWQWSSGSGADPQPYFRIFNPVAQGQKFDADGAYVRRWLPELARLPDAHLHAPWEAPPLILRAAGVTLGATYPAPIVDHAAARARFLALAKAHLGR